MIPVHPDTVEALQKLTPLQLAWLSGWCWAKAGGESQALPETPAQAAPAAAPSITIISASQTGNARKVAENLLEKLTAQGTSARLVAARDYTPKKLADEQYLIVITSTQGDGEPPEEALPLYKFLHGKKAPKLDGLHFAVLGLGDSSYPLFCQAGKDFDARLEALGGKRLLARGDCDLDFRAAAEAWTAQILPLLAGLTPAAAPQAATSATTATASVYDRDHPFTATLAVRQKITGRYSDKDVQHIEIDLSGSGLTYQPGDALGVWYENDAALVDEILAALHLNGSEAINGKTLRDALISDYELTRNTATLAKAYAPYAASAELDAALAEDAHAFAAAHPPVALIKRYPAHLAADEFLALLRPLTPRLYSIASAQDEVGEEVHLTVGVVRYEHDGQTRSGGASAYLGERLAEDGAVRVFVESSPHFRLPQNPDTPVIMIGAGTGIAPYRAFMQQRVAAGDGGKNWLIFGNPRFSEDFLYQTEWQKWSKDGHLHQYHFAWSRDQAEKIYVQDKIRANADALWQWVQDGAHIYVCGDAARMAKDVENALLDVIAAAGGLDAEAAEEYLDGLRTAGRYQRDVY